MSLNQEIATCQTKHQLLIHSVKNSLLLIYVSNVVIDIILDKTDYVNKLIPFAIHTM